MAEVNVNSGNAFRFEGGGRIIIDPPTGLDTYPVLLYEPGSLSIREGQRALAEYTDRGDTQVPILGDKQYTELSFRVRPTKLGMTGASDLMNLLKAANSTTGLVGVFDITIEVPDGVGASTGYTTTISNCFLAPGTQHQMGGNPDQLDSVTITLRSTDQSVDWSTY